jgi:putative flippase GtrA
VTLGGIARRLAGSRFLRFGAVGSGGYIVDNLVLLSMIDLVGLDRYSGRIVSFLAAATFTWWGNRYFTFSDRRAHGFSGATREWARFILANAVGGLVNVGLYATIVRFAPPPLNNPFLALPFGVAAGLTFNFFFSRQLVFREPPVA